MSEKSNYSSLYKKIDRLFIGPVKLSVEWEEDLEVEGDPCQGCFSPSESLIQICINPTLGAQQVTFLHEIVHAILHETGVSSSLTEESEELVCRVVSLFFSQILRNQPEVVEFLKIRGQ